jgi:hypothetical protein
MCIFRKKSVSRVNGVNFSNFRGADDTIDLEIAFRTSGLSDANCLIRQLDVQGVDICLGVNSDGGNSKFLTGSDNP